MNQLAFNFAQPTLPPIGAVLFDKHGRAWQIISADRTHANMLRADLPRQPAKRCTWNNAHGEALGWALPISRFQEEFA